MLSTISTLAEFGTNYILNYKKGMYETNYHKNNSHRADMHRTH